MPCEAAPLARPESPAEASAPPAAAPPVASVAAAPAATAVSPELRFCEPPSMTWVSSPTLKLRSSAARITGIQDPKRRMTSRYETITGSPASEPIAARLATNALIPSRG